MADSFLARLWRYLMPRRLLPLGRQGERLAGQHLKKLGYRILAHSYRCPLGELDLVVVDGDTLVFVEVRTRADNQHGEAWETIGPVKRRKLSSLAAYFLKHFPQWAHRPARFDVVSIEWSGDSAAPPRIQHFPDAFSPDGPWH